MPDILTVVIDKASASSNSLVGAVTGKRVRVYWLWIQAEANNTLTWEDSDGTNLTGVITLNARERIDWIAMPDGVGGFLPRLVTAKGKGFNMLLGSAQQVSGVLGYSQED